MKPAREWQGLTEEESATAWRTAVHQAAIEGNANWHFARAIEAKLKEKNG